MFFSTIEMLLRFNSVTKGILFAEFNGTVCERLYYSSTKKRRVADLSLGNLALDYTLNGSSLEPRCRGQFFFASGAHCTPTLFRSFNPFTPVRAPRRPAARG